MREPPSTVDVAMVAEFSGLRLSTRSSSTRDERANAVTDRPATGEASNASSASSSRLARAVVPFARMRSEQL